MQATKRAFSPVVAWKSQFNFVNPRLPTMSYFDLSASYHFRESVEVRGGVNNLLDKDPPIAPGGNGYPTNPVYFDTYGMTWKVGFRARF